MPPLTPNQVAGSAQSALAKYHDCVGSSEEEAFVSPVLSTHGPVGMGKTLFMASASEFFPEDMDDRKGKPIAVLEDIAWVPFDGGATASLTDKRIRCPFEVNVDKLLAKVDGDYSTLMRVIPDILGEWVATKGLKYLVIGDTMSEGDRRLNTFWEKTTRQDFGNLSGKVTVEHRKYLERLRPLRVPLLASFHQSVSLDFGDKETASQKALKDARAVGGQKSAIVPEITNKASSLYVGNADLELAMFMRPHPKNPKQDVRWVYTKGTAEVRAKSRWSDHLAEIEPAHLGNIIKKIRMAVAEVQQAK